jgi:hypothetical protein
MAVTILWIMLAVAAVLWEEGCGRSGGRWTSLADLGARLGGRLPGLIVLVTLFDVPIWAGRRRDAARSTVLAGADVVRESSATSTAPGGPAGSAGKS